MNEICHRQCEENIPLPARLIRVGERVRARLEAALEDAGLSLPKFIVLVHLTKTGEPLPLTRLAERISCVKSNITQLVDRLEADGLVKRIDDPEDRRSVLASITDEGRRRYEMGGQILAATERDLLKSFKEDELELLNDFLSRLDDD